MTPKNMAASVRARLLNRSRETGERFQDLLVRYGIERVLDRVVQSDHAERFVLKGAMLFFVWTGELHRPTRDLDLLGFGVSEPAALDDIFREILSQDADDGLGFDLDSLEARRIREDNPYQGVRLTVRGYLGSAHVPLQIDIGYGDSIQPEPEMVVYPTLLDLNEPRLKAYRRETVIAEKFEAMVTLGFINTRMKDFFDIFVLARDFDFDGDTLKSAIGATFERRQVALPDVDPVAWTPEFHDDELKQRQWQAFLRKSKLAAPSLPEVCRAIADFLRPVVDVARVGDALATGWSGGGPWQ